MVSTTSAWILAGAIVIAGLLVSSPHHREVNNYLKRERNARIACLSLVDKPDNDRLLARYEYKIENCVGSALAGRS